MLQTFSYYMYIVRAFCFIDCCVSFPSVAPSLHSSPCFSWTASDIFCYTASVVQPKLFSWVHMITTVVFSRSHENNSWSQDHKQRGKNSPCPLRSSVLSSASGVNLIFLSRAWTCKCQSNTTCLASGFIMHAIYKCAH